MAEQHSATHHDDSQHNASQHGARPQGEHRADPHAAAGDDRLYYALYTVFARRDGAPAIADAAAAELDQWVAGEEEREITTRGFYDVSGMREDADVMVWIHGETPEDLQAAIRRLRRTEAFAGTKIVWSTMGVHRDAEFTRNHAPSFAKGIAPEQWVTVYPFVRSWDWYYMNAGHRADIMKSHGLKGRDYPQVLPNTIATFGLNDYEWVLALEAPELVDLVDMMRHFRNTEARLYVREETPFYAGRRVGTDEVLEVLR